MVDIYADEGLTGTSMEKRDELNRLIRDCKKAQPPLAGVHGGHAAAARVGAVGTVPPAVIFVQGAVTERVLSLINI